MDISTTEFKRCVVVKASGRVDGSTAPDLRKVMEKLTDEGKSNVVFDMTNVSFMSSAGWWVLIDTQKKVKPGGEVVLANIEEGIRDSLNLVGMGTYFTIFDDVVSAVGNF